MNCIVALLNVDIHDRSPDGGDEEFDALMSGAVPEKPEKPKVKKVVKKVESRKRELDSDSSNNSGPR